MDRHRSIDRQINIDTGAEIYRYIYIDTGAEMYRYIDTREDIDKWIDT